MPKHSLPKHSLRKHSLPRHNRLWPLLLVAILAAGCAGNVRSAGPGSGDLAPEARQAASAPASDPRFAAIAPALPGLGGAQQAGGITGWLLSDPIGPAVGTNTLIAIVADGEGQPVNDARVSFDLDMTNMKMPVYVVEAEERGNGHYGAEVRYSMRGPWRARVSVERPGQPKVQLSFDYSVSTSGSGEEELPSCGCEEPVS